MIADRLIPAPKRTAFVGRSASVEGYAVQVEPRGEAVYAQAEALLRASLRQALPWGEGGGYPIRLRVQNDGRSEAYTVEIGEDGAAITGSDAAGAYYACVTFGRLLEDGALPIGTVEDWPDFPQRGLFIENRFGSDFLTREDWLRAIDEFSRMKFNRITVGVYGCWCQQYDGRVSEYLYVPFQSHPELKTPRHVKYYSVARREWVYQPDRLPVMYETDYLGELIAYGKARNVEVIPLFNSYGHNTLIPRMIPAVSAKDETGADTGFGLCTRSEETLRVMGELYDELIDRYILPNGGSAIHIGLDEVWAGIGMDAVDPFRFHTPFCQCEACRAHTRAENMVEYVLRVCEHLKQRGLKRVYLYYDMLHNEFDALGEDFERMLRERGLYDTVVIDWWNYSAEDRLFPKNPPNARFHSIVKPFAGYYHWSMPTESLGNIHGCARLARKLGYEGVEAYASLEPCHDRSYKYISELSWNAEGGDDFMARYAREAFPGRGGEAENALREMALVMNSDTFAEQPARPNELFRLEYYLYTYVNADKPYPRDFPEEVFERIFADRARYEAYFSDTRERARRALTFLDGSDPREIARVWRLIALTYETCANEYLELMLLSDGEENAKARLIALIEKREALMLEVERVRMKATSYQCLRNMSVYRQILLDLLKAVEKTGRMPKLTDLKDVKGEAFRFVR